MYFQLDSSFHKLEEEAIDIEDRIASLDIPRIRENLRKVADIDKTGNIQKRREILDRKFKIFDITMAILIILAIVGTIKYGIFTLSGFWVLELVAIFILGYGLFGYDPLEDFLDHPKDYPK